VFLSIVYLNGQRLVQFIYVFLSCSPIVISILTFLYEIFEIIKMMMMLMKYEPREDVRFLGNYAWCIFHIQMYRV